MAEIKLQEGALNMLKVLTQNLVNEDINEGVSCYAVLRDATGRDIGNYNPDFTIMFNKDRFTISPEICIRCTMDVDKATLFAYLKYNGVAIFFQTSVAGIYKNDIVSLSDIIIS